MTKVISLRLRAVAACVVTGVLALASSTMAAAFTIVFPAGYACEFALGVDISGGNSHMKEFKNGRIIIAGTGSALTFTNLATTDTFSLNSNGFSEHLTTNPDGTQTVVTTGHNVIILFPTDTPPGPSTTLYVGRVVYTVDTLGNYYLQGSSGNNADICAALS